MKIPPIRAKRECFEFRVSSFELKTLNLKLKTRNFKLQPEVPFVSEKNSTSKKDLSQITNDDIHPECGENSRHQSGESCSEASAALSPVR